MTSSSADSHVMRSQLFDGLVAGGITDAVDLANLPDHPAIANSDTPVPSRPGEFHPEPLTDSGREPLNSSGSCHRTKAAAFR